MPHIERLAPHVADLIAAGEVVERPASVVKELLENAIDAGAGAVTVEIRGGGMSYLRVSDDGCGIAPEELPTAFLRHATSKLRRPEDLAAIGTLGFRGEALAAIAAVSRLDIFTRTPGAEAGAALHLEGGVPGEVCEAGCPEGTSVIVRDLFFNTPARLKFMKRDSAEGAAVSGLVGHLALSHPELSLRFLRDGKEALHTPGDGQLKSAVYAVLGREFARSLLETRSSDGDYALGGFITRPLAGRGTRGMQTFFVNGRFVKSQLLTAALEEAYNNRNLKGKFPGCVLNVSLPHGDVDVNVHPAKTLVKFTNEKRVFDLVYHGAMDTLNREGRDAAAPAIPAEKAGAPFYRSMTAEAFRASQGGTRARNGQNAADTAFRTRIPPVGSELGGGMSFSDVTRSAPEVSREMAAPSAPAAPAAPETPSAAPAAETQLSLNPAARVPWRIAGEVLDTYIVCEDEAGNVWLIDKHAAHERINFDRFKASAEPLMAQELISPVVATLSAAERAALLGHAALLRSFGFGCEDFGGDSVLLREIPADLDPDEAVSALEELAGKLLLAHDADARDARDAMLATLACKASIRGGMKSGERELRVLVDKVQSGEISYCPHGRPVKAKLSRAALETMFKRS